MSWNFLDTSSNSKGLLNKEVTFKDFLSMIHLNKCKVLVLKNFYI